MKQEQIIAELEKLIDASTLFDVAMSLSLVCDEKAEHIECTWQDKKTARPWKHASGALMTAVRRIQELGI